MRNSLRTQLPGTLLVPLLVACSVPAEVPPRSAPYVRGPVGEFTHHATASSLEVAGGPGSREPCGIVATVDGATRYLRRAPDGTVAAAERGQVTRGDTVEVHVTGDVQESCSVQAYGATIVIVFDLPS